jgi:uncharacterized cupin superfamily protein
VIPEAPLEDTEHGLAAKGEGWYVLNGRDAPWYHVEGRGASCDFEGDLQFPQVGVLQPGEGMAMYHWEADQEDFLVVAGDALLIVEGEEQPLRAWDFVHSPPTTKHTIVGAGEGPCIVVAVGAREHVDDPDWGGYTVDEAALRHEVGSEQETSDSDLAYATVRERHGILELTRYRDGWLP